MSHDYILPTNHTEPLFSQNEEREVFFTGQTIRKPFTPARLAVTVEGFEVVAFKIDGIPVPLETPCQEGVRPSLIVRRLAPDRGFFFASLIGPLR